MISFLSTLKVKVKLKIKFYLYFFVKIFMRIYVFFPKRLVHLISKIVGEKKEIVNIEIAKMLFFEDVKKGNISINYSKFKERELHRFNKDNLIIGPWHSEIGYELLYWIPYISKRISNIFKKYKRIIVISRGGVKCWYDWIDGAEYYNIEDVEPDLLKKIFKDRKDGEFKKKMSFGKYERKIIKSVCKKVTLNIDDCDIIDPSFMYLSIWSYLSKEKGIKSLIGILQKNFKFNKKSSKEIELNNLKPYIAIKIYSNSCFQIKDVTNFYEKKILKILEAISLLNVNLIVLDFDAKDDHTQFDFKKKIFSNIKLKYFNNLYPNINFNKNVNIQNDIVKSSLFLLSSYGGFSYLPQMHNLKSLSISNEGDHIINRHSQTSNLIKNYVQNINLNLDNEIINNKIMNFIKGF